MVGFGSHQHSKPFGLALLLLIFWGKVFLHGEEIQSYGLFKGQQMIFVDVGVIKVTKLDQAEFRAWARGDSGSLLSASVQAPSGGVLNLASEPLYSGLAAFSKVATLESTYPAGDYQFSFGTSASGTRQAKVALPTSSFPPTPEWVDASMMTALNGAVDTEFKWKPFTNATADNLISVAVVDRGNHTLYSTPLPGQLGVLPASATSILIPPSAWGNFAVGQTDMVNVILTFYKVTSTDTASISNAVGLGGFYTSTRQLAQITWYPPDVPAVTNFGVARGTVAYQTKPVTGTLLASSAAAYSWAHASVVGKGHDVSLTRPSGETSPLFGSTTGWYRELLADYASKELMTAWTAYPPGEYRMEIEQPDECTLRVPLTLTSGTPPGFVTVQNYDDCQKVDPNQAFELRWDLAGVTGADAIQFRVEDNHNSVIYQSPGFGVAGCLASNATSVTIPKNTLIGGQAYQGVIRVYHSLSADPNLLLGAIGRTATFSETRFPMAAGNPVFVDTQLMRIAGLMNLDAALLGEEISLRPVVYYAALPVTWSVSYGSLPAGLSLSPVTGCLHGYPQAIGTSLFQIQATDRFGHATNATMSITVVGEASPPQLGDTPLPTSEKGTYYSESLNYSGGVPPLTWSVPSGQMPAGISLNQNGVLQGDAAAGGLFTFSAMVTDATGKSSTQEFTWNIPDITPETIETVDSFSLTPDGKVKIQASGSSDAAYTVEQGSDLTAWETVGTPGDLVNNPATLPGSGTNDASFYRLSMVSSNTPPDTWDVVAKGDESRAVEQCVDSKGAVLTTTDANGIVYTLTIPAGALLKSRWVRMIPAKEMVDSTGAALTGGGGVIFEPDGTHFAVPGQLTVQLGQNYTNAYLYCGSGSGTDLHPVFSQFSGNTLTAPVAHFTIFRIDQEARDFANSRSCSESAEAATKMWQWGKLPAGQRTYAAVVKIYRDYLKTVWRARIEPAVGNEIYVNDAANALAEFMSDTGVGDVNVRSALGGGYPSLLSQVAGDLQKAKQRLTLAYKNAVYRNRDRCSKRNGPAQGFKVRYYAEQAVDASDLGIINPVDRNALGKVVQDCLRLRWGYQGFSSHWMTKNEMIPDLLNYVASVKTEKKGTLVYDFRSQKWLEDDKEAPWVCAVPDDVGVYSSLRPSAVHIDRRRVSHLPSLEMKESPLKIKDATTERGCATTSYDFELTSVDAFWAPLGAFRAMVGDKEFADSYFTGPLLTIMTDKGYLPEVDFKTMSTGWHLSKIAQGDEGDGWRLVNDGGSDGLFAQYQGHGTKGDGTSYMVNGFKVFLYYDPIVR